jgi:magnesium-transporting ATPase (P-type)
MKRLFLDERTERINGQVSFICLMLTQAALAGVIVYKRYILGLPEEKNAEIAWIVSVSMAGYWAIRLYFSGILPVISFKKMLALYITLVTCIVIPTYFIHGLPVPERRYELFYPFIGVALILGFYSLLAYLGKRRIEKNILE